jgi:H+/Cl- antiporter ClcA
MSRLMPVFVVLGVIFGIIAGLMAYLITYEEYVHHFPDKRQPKKLSLQAGLFAFAVIFGIALLAGYLLMKFL